ncbi:DUF4123 domain-containing protein [Pseudomonas sp. Fl4BN1]|uniref:DUF4123 domain-containing protein n=1 Tax=Pseudomonas sp. Fl4BN1 TaxID=2697651 RepID=UPI001377CADC|nr:DUF4123 domain-containing protein [Pseudomonas sp. Fl4BN1]NBF10906.1 DUF4123 domain-containing protein [Pseudomonas sp. Fl4BN1]
MIKSISSPFQVPAAPGFLCAILDASFDPDLQDHVDQAIGYGAERCIPLFDNTPYGALQAAGPFVLLCPLPGALMEYAGTLLEQAYAGCVAYLESEHSFEQAIEHWRSLLTVGTDDTPAQLMRFFDPRWLEPLLNSLDETQMLKFMGPLTDIAWRNELGWRHLAHPRPEPGAEIQDPGWLHLGCERQALMDLQRLKVLAGRLAQDYRAVLPMPEPVAFVYQQLLAARNTGYLQVAEQERWLRLALRQGDGFWNRSPHTELLARDDLGLGDKLIALERL